MSEEDRKKAIENIQPILYVKNMKASIDYYEKVLGFEKAEWGDTFTAVGRDDWGIYLCEGAQ